MRLIGNVAAALAGQLDLRDDHRLLHDSLEARSAPTSCRPCWLRSKSTRTRSPPRNATHRRQSPTLERVRHLCVQ